MNTKNNVIITSFYKDNIKFCLLDRSIIFESLPLWSVQNKIMVQVCNDCGRKKYENTIWINTPHNLSLPKLVDGEYTLHLYYKSLTGDGYFYGLNSSKGFPFKVCKGVLSTIISKPFENNKKIFLQLTDEYISKHDSSVTSFRQYIPNEIVQLAQQIVKHSFSTYEKTLAIHDWVAENIYYDYDSLDSGEYKTIKHDALTVLQNKRCVCSGYSQLTVTLLNAVGIHAINTDCFSLGHSSEGDWNKTSNMTDPANHVITFAYADGRWIMMDTTWDSDNEYRNGKYKKRTGHGVSHQYFDCTLAFFSYTHRFIK